jgi:lipopolysaccharide/colanic/teichoic acid biosynthesis glycosyltransferase
MFSPILLLIAGMVYADSPGPVFFRQERVGQFGRVFRIHKFRTMYVGAEMLGAQITVGADIRITRVGAFLRRYKLDELPQLIDVLFGDMSLVGPRPEVPRYVAHYPKRIRELVLSVRPGVTDRASIEFKDENEILGRAVDPHQAYLDEVLPVKLGYYADYVQNHSLIGDIWIIALTLRAIVHRGEPE